MERLKQMMTERGLGNYYERMKHLARNAIHVEPVVVPADEIPVGASKFGGIPDLPEGFVWPRLADGAPLPFLCQFDLAELAPYDRDGLLPKEGLLSFFYDVNPMPDCWYDEEGWAVFYHVGQELKRQRGPEDVPGYFTSARVEITATPELPFLHSDIIQVEKLEGDEYWDLWEFTDHLAATGDDSTDVCTKLLGHARPVQSGGGLELTCERFHRRKYGSEGCRYEDPRDPRNACRWINLLQLDSHENVGWIWAGGYGRVYFWIEEDDLKNCRFDRVAVIAQTS